MSNPVICHRCQQAIGVNECIDFDGPYFHPIHGESSVCFAYITGAALPDAVTARQQEQMENQPKMSVKPEEHHEPEVQPRFPGEELEAKGKSHGRNSRN